MSAFEFAYKKIDAWKKVKILKDIRYLISCLSLLTRVRLENSEEA